MDQPASSSGETLRQDEGQSEASRRLSGKEAARQDPSAPKIEGYVLSARLGAGAFGEVWKAWQQRTGKWVALKVFPRRHGVDWLLMQREVERLIKLDKHPNVVSLLDADLTGDPPFFVMELMEGGSLARFVDPARRASPEEAARWGEQIAEALAYVHAKGILHCDLKPANVLLDDQGRVRVADFGQSRIVSESTGALGTLYFMAPEQALTFRQNEQLYPDVRWDIFGLGATLHAVLTGVPPHEAALKEKLAKTENLEARLAEYRDGIRSQPAPSSGADEDLAAIVRRCVEPWPEKRYTSAAAVVADLVARREIRPVSPLAGDNLYRLKKFVNRNAAAAALGALLAVALAGGTTMVFRQNVALESELANAYLLRARAAAEKRDEGGAAVLYARSNVLHPTSIARRGAMAHLQSIARPANAWSMGEPVRSVFLSPDGSRLLAEAGGKRLLIETLGGATVADLSDNWSHLDPIGAYQADPAAFSADGSRAIVGAGDKIRLVEGQSGKEVAKLDARYGFFSPDGKLVACADHTEAGSRISFFEAATGKRVGGTLRHPRSPAWDVPWVEFSKDGKTLLTSMKETIALWAVPSGRSLGAPLSYDSEQKLAIGLPEAAHFSPDGAMILSVTRARALLLDRKTGKPVGKVMRHDGDVTDAMFANGSVVTAGEDGTLRQWTSGGVPVDITLRHGAPITALAVGADGKLAVTGGSDGIARLWSLEPMGAFGKAMLHGSPVLSAVFSSDGKWLATGSRDGTVRLWQVPAAAAGHSYVKLYLNGTRFSPDASRLVGFDYTNGPQVMELPSGKLLPTELSALGKSKDFSTIGFGAKGSRLVTVVRDANEAQVWDLAAGKRIGTFSHADVPKSKESFSAPSVQVARLDTDGKRLLTYSLGSGLRLWEVDSGKKLAEAKPSGYVYDAAFSPSGDRVAVAMDQTEIRDGSLAKVLVTLKGGGGHLAWSPDGRRVATAGGKPATVQLWDAASGAALGKPAVHEADLWPSQFSADGALLMTSSRDGTAKLLNGLTGELIGVLAHGDEVWSTAISPDGTAAATAGMDGAIRLWDTRTAEPLGRPLVQGRLVNGLAFTPDGKTLYATGNWSVQGWDVSWLSSVPPSERLYSAAQSLAQRRIDEAGRVVVIPFAEWDRRVPLP